MTPDQIALEALLDASRAQRRALALPAALSALLRGESIPASERDQTDDDDRTPHLPNADA
jgi:hypothetical protein